MYFTAGQERQAEEEYAFKSSISFSLEPYRGLLGKMREQGDVEAEFVRKLMVDIFDNPVKRLYKQKDDDAETESLVGILTSICGKMSPAKMKVITDALQRLSS